MQDTPESATPSPQVRIHEDLGDIAPAAWNALGVADYPFLHHEFLHAMERHRCVGEHLGWLPRHITVSASDGSLLGAVPLYLKFNSYGEFVFDWAWAEAYTRQGMDYYPKLVCASPYTPATGPRLLLHPQAPSGTADMLIAATQRLAEASGASSLHWLFTDYDQTERLRRHGFMIRTGCQFHWHNDGYRDFDDFLTRFRAAKRKRVKRERRHVVEAGIELRLRHGDQTDDNDWRIFHRLYESTFNKRGGLPTLSLDFFREIAARMPRQILLVQALQAGRVVAAAFNLVGTHTLYGRHWGCYEDFHSLHFEACYYQGLEYCIANGLRAFEPGAQGEHKIGRGFLPTATWSAHWIGEPRFAAAIGRYLLDETDGMQDYMVEMSTHSPYSNAGKP